MPDLPALCGTCKHARPVKGARLRLTCPHDCGGRTGVFALGCEEWARGTDRRPVKAKAAGRSPQAKPAVVPSSPSRMDHGRRGQATREKRKRR